MKHFTLTCCTLALLSLTASASAAQQTRTHAPAAKHGPNWEGDIARFDKHDLDVWHSGKWVRAEHDNRLGWWWVVGNAWYFYPFPIYPYPDPFQPPVVVQETYPPPFWYYCADPVGYYPYIAKCRVDWEKVPVSPQTAGTGAAPQK